MAFENVTKQDIIDDLKDIVTDLEETLDYLREKVHTKEAINPIIAAKHLIESSILEIEGAK